MSYLPEVERMRQVTAPLPAFLALTEMQYSSPMVSVCWMPSVILQLSACYDMAAMGKHDVMECVFFNSFTHLSSRVRLDGEGSVRHLLAAVLDVDLVLAQVIRRVGGLKSAVAIVGHFDFARVAVGALQIER